MPLAPVGIEVVPYVGVKVARELPDRNRAVASDHRALAQHGVGCLDVLEEIPLESDAALHTVEVHGLEDLHVRRNSRCRRNYLRAGL